MDVSAALLTVALTVVETVPRVAVMTAVPWLAALRSPLALTMAIPAFELV